MTLTADWNDVDAAIDLALSENELAIVSRSSGGYFTPRASDVHERQFVIKSVADEFGVLEVTRQTDAEESVAITISCSIGRFGDPEREQKFLASIERRLRQLHGVDYRPL